MVKTTVYLDEDLAEAVKAEAERRGQTQAELIREAVREAVQPVPRSRLVGAFSDGTVQSSEYEDYLRERWGKKQ